MTLQAEQLNARPFKRQPVPSAALGQAIYRVTSEQYHRMMDDGVIPDGAPTELIHGLVVWKDRGISGDDLMGHSPEHVLVISLISDLASRINGPFRHLKIQLPIHANAQEEPEPDASIVRGQPRDYAGRLPNASEVFCVMEVAQTSLERDMQDKLPVYAGAGIPQYIIVNLRQTQIEIFSDPDVASGTYRSRTVAKASDIIKLNLGRGEFLSVTGAELLP